MAKITLATLVATAAVLLMTPAMSSNNSSDAHSATASSGGGHPLETTGKAPEPPDPCIQLKQRRAHERCVTRQMNVNSIHGGPNVHAIWGQGESKPY